MPKRVVGVAAFVAFASVPARAPAQGGIAIEHKAVECIVAGKFPKMSSCFAPSGDVARARVYFRPEGVESWYYVDMKSDAPCLAGILPRPRKELVGKHVDYYVQATDRGFNEARTAEYNPLVVDSESECKDKPVAPYLSKASVQVFPGMPAGFAAGGAATLPIIGGVAVVGGAAAGVAAASGDSNPPASPTTTPAPTTTAPAATTTTTTTTTLRPPSQGFRFVFRVSPDPPRGLEPLRVTIDMCRSTPANQLRYYFNFDGGSFDFIGNQCSQTRTLSRAGASGRLPPTTTLPPPPRVPREFTFPLQGCAELRENPATQQCGNALARVTEDLSSGASAAVRVKPLRPNPGNAVRRLSWASELNVEGGAGQIIANGQAAVFAGRGRSNAIANGRRGDNRIEAQLVQAQGKPGTWRFELGATSSLVPGSLRVIAGEVATISGDAITFRLKGTPGERVVFSFKTAR